MKDFSDGWSLYPQMTTDLLRLQEILRSILSRLKTLERLDGIYTICLHPHIIGDDDLARLERFFRDHKPSVVTARTLVTEAGEISRRGLCKRALDFLFTRLYKRQEQA